MRVTGAPRDLLDLKIRRAQQLVREFEPLAPHELRRRLPEQLTKSAAQLRVVHAGTTGENRQAWWCDEVRRQGIMNSMQLSAVAPRKLAATAAEWRKHPDVAQRNVEELVRLGARVQPVQRIVAVGAHDLAQQRHGRTNVRPGAEARGELNVLVRTQRSLETGRRARIHLIEPEAVAVEADPGFAPESCGAQSLAGIVAAPWLEPQQPRG